MLLKIKFVILLLSLDEKIQLVLLKSLILNCDFTQITFVTGELMLLETHISLE